MFEDCHFITNITALRFYSSEEAKPNDINLRMAQSYFTLKTSDKNTKIIYFEKELQVPWKLWKTEFQINTYHTMSSDKNFAKNINKIIMVDQQQMFQGTISETEYASGNYWEWFRSFPTKINLNL